MTEAELVPEDKRSPTETKKWRDEAQMKARISVAESEQRLANAKPWGRGSQVEPEGQCPSWSQVRANWLTGQGGVMSSKV